MSGPVETRTPLDSPALKFRSPHYPRRGFGGYEERVPLRVRMLKTVRSEWPFGLGAHAALARMGDEYECWVNSHGAVAAFTPGGLLGVKPGEFEVVAYHPCPCGAPLSPEGRCTDEECGSSQT